MGIKFHEHVFDSKDMTPIELKVKRLKVMRLASLHTTFGVQTIDDPLLEGYQTL